MQARSGIRRNLDYKQKISAAGIIISIAMTSACHAAPAPSPVVNRAFGAGEDLERYGACWYVHPFRQITLPT
jgi:hypothetical protein